MNYVENGMGCSVNFKKLFVLFVMCLYLGMSGVIAHAGDIAKLTRQAAKGDADAQLDLAIMYDFGRGIPVDYKKAVHYYELCAEQGNILAQTRLGMLYVSGRGVPQDDMKAVYYYELAAKQGDAIAQSDLGYMYTMGRGVPQDDKKAVYYYELAAKQGAAEALNNLGVQYALGQGVPQNDVKAYAHALVAFALDNTQSKLKEILEPKLTPSQREQGQALASKMWDELPK